RIVLLAVWAGLIVFGRARGRWVALLLVLTVAVSDQLCASVIKPFAGRLRPCEVLGGVHFWSDTEGWMTTPAQLARSYKSSFSFPSNHASNMTAAMLLLGLVYRKGLPWFLLVAGAVSYSRIYVGVHWPLDVAAGIATGATLATLAYLVHRRIGRRRWRTTE
ncbi:MAG TPA: phosphatase PAP2 family protein, partial [Candidatus Krumholzibacterium sp.]|nr:phosphatase PAP2 family protein [Candidatus Krumholzibacterium sp.]